MSEFVLDASAVLAVIFNEAGGEKVRQLRSRSCINAVNLAEVVTACVEHGGNINLIRTEIDDLYLETVAFDSYLAMDAGFLRTATRKQGLSLGDRACLATARRIGATVLTADRHWKGLNAGVDIEFLR